MSTVKANNVQVGQSGTATNNFTLYQPSSPDGTVRLAVGNSGATSADVLTANSSGNVGIGVTPSAWGSSWRALQVASVGSLWGNASSSSGLYVGSNYYFDGTNRRYITTNPAIELSLGSGGTFALLQAPSGTAGNVASFTQALQLNANGGLQTLNTISVGNTTPSTSGAGITFPATQSASSDANTLDDYEEGTWTPTITCGTPGTLSVTYTTQTGSYTKIGRLVTANFLLTFNITKGTAAGDASIGGLPFSISGASDRFSGAIGFVNNLGTANIIGLLGGGGTTSSLIGAINGSTLAITAITDGNSRSIRGTLSYEI